jgi:hypothetical protein
MGSSLAQRFSLRSFGLLVFFFFDFFQFFFETGRREEEEAFAFVLVLDPWRGSQRFAVVGYLDRAAALFAGVELGQVPAADVPGVAPPAGADRRGLAQLRFFAGEMEVLLRRVPSTGEGEVWRRVGDGPLFVHAVSRLRLDRLPFG